MGVTIAGDPSLPTLTQLNEWPTEHFTQLADWCDAEAKRWEDSFNGVYQQVKSADWNGAGKDAAVSQTERDLYTARGAAQHLRDAAPLLRTAGENERFAKAAVLRAVADAKAAGFSVGEDLSVSDPTDYTTWEQATARRNDARAFAQDIHNEASALLRIDQDIAERLPAISAPLRDVGFAENGHNGHDVQLVGNWKRSPGDKGGVPGPHPGDAPYATGETPTLAGDPHDVPPMKVDPGSSDTVQLSDNPPGYNGPAGPERDAAWLAYLSKHDGTTDWPAVPGDMRLPNPDAVSDPGLKTVGAAARQQGVSYAWGAGHPGPPDTKTPNPPGVTNGTLHGDLDGNAARWGDNERTGFDCSGLARFATSEGHNGLDISKGTWGDTKSQYHDLTAGGTKNMVFDADLKPGDLIYFGPQGDSHHVAIYAGNGLMIEAHQSGVPIEVSPMRSERHVNVHIPN